MSSASTSASTGRASSLTASSGSGGSTGLVIQGTVCNHNPVSYWCGGVCRDTGNDDNNCGYCGHVCPQGTRCNQYQCVLDNCNGLGNGQACELRSDGGVGGCCAGKCLSVQSDSNNCGACGALCSSGEICLDAECSVTSCAGGVANRQACVEPDGGLGACCSGGCTELLTDSNNCGTCGRACPAGQICAGNDCILEGCPTDGGGAEAICVGDAGGGLCCPGGCLNTSSDPNNCGNCGVTCLPNQLCLSGGCMTLDCTAPAASGESCINPTTGEYGTCCGGGCIEETDNGNCGHCGLLCPQGSSCGIYSPEDPSGPAAEPPDGTQCVSSGKPLDCETLTCPDGYACTSIGCILTSCDGGSEGDVCAEGSLLGLCCGGACIDSLTSHDHCGVCASNCGDAGACNRGQCVPTVACTLATSNLDCALPNGDLGVCCHGTCSELDGPETCGSCGLNCPPSTVCAGGYCVLSDGGGSGACPQVPCPEGQRCTNGICEAVDCLPGETGSICAWGDGIWGLGQGVGTAMCCDGVCSSILSPESCGACGITCSGGLCSGGYGMCAPSGPYDGGSCEFGGPFCGLSDGGIGECCGFASARGCADVSSDPTNCGRCDQVCPAGQTCSGGVCSGSVPACAGNPGKNCDMDGGGDPVCCGGSCVDITGDPTNCGVCGYPCPFGDACQVGKCVVPACSADAGNGQLCSMGDGGAGACCSDGG